MFKEVIDKYSEKDNITIYLKVYYNTVYIKACYIRLSALIDFCRELKQNLKHVGDIIELQSPSGSTITLEKIDE